MGIHVQGPFEAVVAELASLAPAGSAFEAIADGGPSTSLRYARDDKASIPSAKRGAFGILTWGNARVTFYAGCAQAQPSEATAS
jgi:hypothetical protein